MKKIMYMLVLILAFSFSLSDLLYANEDYANKLRDLGIFQGSDRGYELDRQPTRLEGLVIMLRLMGEEDNAKQFVIQEERFKDLPEWGKPYVYYAFAKGITKGVSQNTFAPNSVLESYAFLTYILRAMGYQDGGGTGADFTWDQPELFAMSKNLVNESQLAHWSVKPFFRRDLVRVAYTALKTKTKDEQILAQVLIAKGNFTEKAAISAGITLPEKETAQPLDQLAQDSTSNPGTSQDLSPKTNTIAQADSQVSPGFVPSPQPSYPSEEAEAVKPEFKGEKSYSLIGPPTATPAQVYQWAQSRGMSQEGLDLVDIYFEICGRKGLNPVIQYAQMCHETGFLYKIPSMAGLDTSYHNPCGLKVTEGGDGFVAKSHKRFRDWREGIEAHTDHTALYAGVAGYPVADTPDPRHFSFLRGAAPMLADLSGKWAPSWSYHRKIYIMIQEIEAIHN